MEAFNLIAARRDNSPTRSAIRACALHGEYEVEEYLSVADGEMLGCHPLRCPRCEHDRRSERERRQRHEDVKAGLVAAHIPPRFMSACLEKLVVDDVNRTPVERVVGYAERWPAQLKTGESLLLLGPVGTGKTYSGICLLRKAIESRNGARYTTVSGLISEVKSTWNQRGGAREKDVLEHFANVPLLMLDELGATTGSDHEKACVFDVLDRRYGNMRPTIISGNVTVVELEQVLDARAVDRLREGGTAALFTGTSRRRMGAPCES